MLADAARQFAERRIPTSRVRACRDRVPDHDADVWSAIAELGWLSVLVPESEGGLGEGLAGMGQLVYEWGGACAPEPLVATGVLAMQMLVGCEGSLRDELLAAAMEGSVLPALSWVDVGGNCERYPDGLVIQGKARLVVPADATGFVLVFKESASTSCAVWLPRNTAGLWIERERRVDGTCAARLSFDALRLPARNLLCVGGAAARAAENARDSALAMAAVEMSGAMRTINNLTREYLATRVQFGKPIGSFQALQYKAVDMHIAEQMARDVAQDVCAQLDAGGTPAQRACLSSRAKARAGESLDKIARAAVQLHGAIGFTDEYDLSLFVNRALVLSAWLGNADAHVERYARNAPAFEAAEA